MLNLAALYCAWHGTPTQQRLAGSSIRSRAEVPKQYSTAGTAQEHSSKRCIALQDLMKKHFRAKTVFAKGDQVKALFALHAFPNRARSDAAPGSIQRTPVNTCQHRKPVRHTGRRTKVVGCALDHADPQCCSHPLAFGLICLTVAL